MLQRVKTIALFLFILTFSNNQLTAQTFQAGLIGGVNLSQLDGDQLIGFNQIGFNAGGRIAVEFGNKWMWNVDLLFSQKGSNDTPQQTSAFSNIRLNYVEVPLMLTRMDLLADDYYQLHFVAGISYGRLVGFKVIDQLGVDISDFQDYNKNMFDLIVGATYFINKNIGINGQYAFAAVDIENDKNAQSKQGRLLTFRAIYMF